MVWLALPFKRQKTPPHINSLTLKLPRASGLLGIKLRYK
jgi:hypothetical protein